MLAISSGFVAGSYVFERPVRILNIHKRDGSVGLRRGRGSGRPRGQPDGSAHRRRRCSRRHRESPTGAGRSPNAAAMRAHLEHLFGGYLDGFHDGLIELAWTDTRPDKNGRYALRHAAMFGTDQIEELIEKAVQLNSQPMCNVYVGAALRKPGTFPGARASREDVLALTASYCRPGRARRCGDGKGQVWARQADNGRGDRPLPAPAGANVVAAHRADHRQGGLAGAAQGHGARPGR